MDIELDILVGHPEHDILFIATQVARAAGLKDPAGSVNLARKYHKCGHPLATLIDKSSVSLPGDEKGMEHRFVHQFGSLFQAETLKKPKGVYTNCRGPGEP
ncbi:hypothetical protein [Stutzerimonas nosocomialis]|uniref:hypothetical protein n=1 Tax=Stutzerimonas nosocomialis TaxID=1056496 RepID=UPI001109739D|nr:hypothetical protein [Stutzerimonas nosocomialis]